MENYQKLKEVIQATNPEIMELKFGCEVIYRTWPVPDFKRGFVFQKMDKSIGVLHKGRIPDFITPERDIWEILGRPIRLADVLFACGANHIISAPRSGGWIKAVVMHWNFLDDNLDHQSDETKQFLIDLLSISSKVL
jgi:hypothetical protein